jgi:hypothetical protein
MADDYGAALMAFLQPAGAVPLPRPRPAQPVPLPRPRPPQAGGTIEDRRDEDPNDAAVRAFTMPRADDAAFWDRASRLPNQTTDPLAAAAGYNQIRRK